MKLRLEFLKARSTIYPNVVRICKKFESFGIYEEEGVLVHELELEGAQLVSFEAIWQMVWGWKGTVLYVDGQLVNGREMTYTLDRWRRTHQNPMLRVKIHKDLGRIHAEVERDIREGGELN